MSFLSRRSFLQFGCTSVIGFALGHRGIPSAFAAPNSSTAIAKNVIQIFLTGGPSTIDMWDLKPDAPAAIRGDFHPIETSVPSLQICEYLPKLAKQMHRATIVRSVTHTIAEHTQGQAYLMTGNRPSPTAESPSLGSLSAALLPSRRGMPVNVSVGTVPSSGAGDLGANFNPLEVTPSDGRSGDRVRESIGLPDGFTRSDLERRKDVLQRLDQKFDQLGSTTLTRQLGQFQQDSLEILRSDKIREALDIEREPESTRTLFGNSLVGRSALAARRLVEADARFVTVGFGDWDTHDNNFTRLRNNLLPQLDQALAALLEDLASRDLLNETIVYCTGEFGRTPTVNTNLGRDHWSRTMSVLLAGGGFRSGSIYGSTDKHGSDPDLNPCSPDDISATIFHQLGFAPEHQLQSASGRSIPLFRNGTVVSELL